MPPPLTALDARFEDDLPAPSPPMPDFEISWPPKALPYRPRELEDCLLNVAPAEILNSPAKMYNYEIMQLCCLLNQISGNVEND